MGRSFWWPSVGDRPYPIVETGRGRALDGGLARRGVRLVGEGCSKQGAAARLAGVIAVDGQARAAFGGPACTLEEDLANGQPPYHPDLCRHRQPDAARDEPGVAVHARADRQRRAGRCGRRRGDRAHPRALSGWPPVDGARSLPRDDGAHPGTQQGADHQPDDGAGRALSAERRQPGRGGAAHEFSATLEARRAHRGAEAGRVARSISTP